WVPPPARTWSINNFLKSVAFSELVASAVSSGCAVCVMELFPFWFTFVSGLAPPHSELDASPPLWWGTPVALRAPSAPHHSNCQPIQRQNNLHRRCYRIRRNRNGAPRLSRSSGYVLCRHDQEHRENLSTDVH